LVEITFFILRTDYGRSSLDGRQLNDIGYFSDRFSIVHGLVTVQYLIESSLNETHFTASSSSCCDDCAGVCRTRMLSVASQLLQLPQVMLHVSS